MRVQLRYKILAVLGVLASVFLWGRCSKPVPAPHKVAAVLPKDDAEQITVNPVRHTITIIKPTGTQTITLPDHPTTIDIRKDGGVVVTSPQWGLEHRFFFGVQGSNAVRFAAGMDAAYFKRLDIGVGIADEIGLHTPVAFVKASYGIWSNVQLGLTYDSSLHIGAAITVRL